MSVWEQEHEVEVDGARLAVREAGRGTPVLLLHGFPDSSDLWRGVVPGLVAAGHRVIAPDQRGYGRSSVPRSRAAYRLDRIVQDAEDVLAALVGDEPAHVVGHDWGGIISWGLCLARPQRVRSHVALSVGHPRAYARAGLEQKRKGWYVGAFIAPGHVGERWLGRNGCAGLRRWGDAHPDLDEVAAGLTREPERLTAGLTWYRVNVATIFLRRWARCTVPTLGVVSTGDRYLADDQMAGSAEHMAAEWRLERIPGGHWIPAEHPQWTAELVAGWAARHEAAPAAVAA